MGPPPSPAPEEKKQEFKIVPLQLLPRPFSFSFVSFPLTLAIYLVHMHVVNKMQPTRNPNIDLQSAISRHAMFYMYKTNDTLMSSVKFLSSTYSSVCTNVRTKFKMFLFDLSLFEIYLHYSTYSSPQLSVNSCLT
jgi:hypothetical protein